MPLSQQIFGIRDKAKNKRSKSLTKMSSDGFGTLTYNSNDSFSLERTGPVALQICPEIDLSNQIFLFPFNTPYANLAEANFENTIFDKANFEKANLKKTNFYGIRAQEASFRDTSCVGANFERARMQSSDFTGADLTGANLTGAWFPADLTDFDITGEQFDSLAPHTIYEYKKKGFYDAAKELGVSDERFEFLVISGVVEVRDDRQKIVTAGFDPEQHHIPIWGIEKAKLALQET